MSFLEELQNRRKLLKNTDTVVTREDGTRFIENDDKSTKQLARAEFGFVVDTKPDNIPSKIIENIYLGAQDCCMIEILQEYNIKNILSIGIESPCKFSNYNYHFVPCLDLPSTNLKDILIDDCIPFIRNSIKLNHNILVHCNAGVSRSSAIIIGYLILVCNYSYSEAYYKVKCARNCIKPNEGFEKQLRLLSP